jgi:hypothetical protein
MLRPSYASFFRKVVGRAPRFFALVTSPAKSARFGRRLLVMRAALAQYLADRE